jgi:hypothetical protein
MPGAFRDELEAARARAEALHEQNEGLREEVERLRRAVKPEADPAPAAPGEDPELARLAERTLERLEHLAEEADAAPPNRTSDPPPRADEAERPSVHPPRPGELPVNPAVRMLAPSPRREDLRETANDELARLRRSMRRGIAIAFVAGVAIGAALVTVMR